MFITISVKVNYIFSISQQGKLSMNRLKSILTISTLMVLAACGGGGGSSTPPSETTYPLRSGIQNLISQSEVNNFTISGTCSGTATETRSAAVPTLFESIAGVSTTTTLTMSFSNCSLASAASTGISYYDTNYKPLGSSTPGTNYEVYSISDLPLSVKVGDTAELGSSVVYSTSTKQVKTGTSTLSYAVETDSGSTAIINLITKGFNTSNQLLYTKQSRYRINTSGQLTAVSRDIQSSTTSTAHLLLTKN